ncbi:pyridoxal phosphate-dependent aminotransferase [Micromonospora siamensis]|uniref:Aminotransferase n=1 Tax=Micromonospora siamensis TaxID=299152 RepID=A0A1C5HEH2_9ACTN|nr:pyridoxal phosphate-dependent aminotransferase [Micromonospora siamensis]SCG44384.1 aminotransferase [Micromonospora siamensis]
MTRLDEEPEAGRHRFAGRARRLSVGGLTKLLGAGVPADTLDFAVGTPAWPDPPAEVVEAACAALRGGANQYAPPDGDLGLRTALAGWLGRGVDPLTELTITSGATEALCVALLATVDPGDEVVVLEPCYENFLTAITVAGAQARFVPLRGDGWRYDSEELAAAFGPRTRAVVVNTPNNPTGRLLTADDIREIGALCERWDTTIISDEVYSSYVFDGRAHLSPRDVPGAGHRTIVLGSLSKSHAISGWRMGFLLADAERTEVLRRVHIVTSGGAAHPLQAGLAEAHLLGGTAWDPRPGLQDRRDRVVEALRGYGLRCVAPQGGCYALADIRDVSDTDSEAFVLDLLAGSRVLFVPGTFFFPNGGGKHLVRVAFNRPDSVIDELVARLGGAAVPATTRGA